jgi:AT hook motif
MAKKKNWCFHGDDGIARHDKNKQEAEARKAARGPMAWWLPKETTGKLTFLDTPRFFVYLHNVKIGESYNNRFTCIREIDDCPICAEGHYSAYCCVGTVVSHKAWVDREGRKHRNQRQLIIFKGRQTIDKLLKQIERREGDLKYCTYEFARGSSPTEVSIGSDWEFLKRLSPKGLLSLRPADADEKGTDWLKPFDYETIFAPKTPAELRKILGLEDPVGSEEDSEAEDYEDLESVDDDEELEDDEVDDEEELEDEEEKPTPKKRGRPKKRADEDEEEKPTPKKRGRPKKRADEEVDDDEELEDDEVDDDEELEDEEEKPTPKKRGRPKKRADEDEMSRREPPKGSKTRPKARKDTDDDDLTDLEDLL